MSAADSLVARWGLQRVSAAAVMAGGAAGALARAGIAEALPRAAGGWPWATLAANLAGTAVLAWLVTRLAGRSATGTDGTGAGGAAPLLWRAGLGTGLCGALTTFSTFQVETIELAREDGAGTAAAYAAVSLSAGMLLAVAVTAAARRRWSG